MDPICGNNVGRCPTKSLHLTRTFGAPVNCASFLCGELLYG
jgi:hypothetical protein